MRVIMFFVIAALCSCSLFKDKPMYIEQGRGYYFLVQLKSINSDTIDFETIQIYSWMPILDIRDSLAYELKLDMEVYNKGYLKNAKRYKKGDIILLYTYPKIVMPDTIATFEHTSKKRYFDLSRPFQLGKCQDEEGFL